MRGRRIAFLTATTAVLLALMPASASAENRIRLCLQGREVCESKGKVEVPKAIADEVVPAVIDSGAHFVVSDRCGLLASGVNGALRDLGVPASVCDTGYGPLGWSSTTEVRDAVKLRCAGEAHWYDGCELGTTPGGPSLELAKDNTAQTSP
jgi:hypothetical protein